MKGGFGESKPNNINKIRIFTKGGFDKSNPYV